MYVYLNQVCKTIVFELGCKIYVLSFSAALLYFQVFVVLVLSAPASVWDYRCCFDRAAG